VAGLAAWLGLERGGMKAGETVVVLGASGVVGQIAVQVARIMGAKRVVAAARDPEGLERARARGAQAVVDLGGGNLTDAFREAAGGGVDVVIDPLWGAPAAAAVEAMNPFGRLVQIGQSAGAEATLTSSSIRGRTLSILGYTTYAVGQERKVAAYRRLVEEAARGRIEVDSETVHLEEIAGAWSRQPRSPHRKLIVVP
jgi:NADPH2:quinone reductase